jgi:hypothetical protein
MSTNTDTTEALAAALDLIRAEGAALIGGGGPERLTWAATVQHLIDHPPYYSYDKPGGATALRALWADFPLSTPFGDVRATIMRAPGNPDPDYGPSFSMTIPRGGSFKVNGAEYAPAEDDPVTGTTINAEFVTSWDKRTAWKVTHSAAFGRVLTDAARRKVSEWIEAEAAALILDPARVAARELYNVATSANSARDARDKAHALAIAADADFNRAAGAARRTLAAAVDLIHAAEAMPAEAVTR